MSAVEVSGLRKRYGATTALDGITLHAETGSVTAVLGPNGAGKTTTIEICCGLRTADDGKVSVLGLDPRKDRPQLTARVGVMPQAGGSSASGVYPSARVREVLALHAALYAEPLPIDSLLARLGLEKVAATPWRRLSGGEQQRLSLALAIVGRPELVFLDEPTAGLDVHARRTTWELVRDLRAAGVTILLTTHAMDEAEQLSDHIVIIDGGRVVASGSPQALTRADDSPRVLRFDAPANLPIEGFPVAGTALERSPGHYEIHGSITPDVLAAVTAWCAARGIMPERLTTDAQSLEDVFLSLTTRTGAE